MSAVRLLVAALLGVALLVVWREVHAATCGSLFLPAIVALVIGLGMRESALLRRRVLVESVFEARGWLYRLLWRGLWITLVALAFACLAAGAMMIELLLLPPVAFLLLLLDVPLLMALFFLIERALRRTLAPRARRIFAKGIAATLNAVLLVVFGTAQGFFAERTHFRIGETVTTYAGTGRCGSIEVLLHWRGRFEAWLWGAMEQAGEALPPALRLAAWLAFVAFGTLGAFAFSRFFVELFAYATRSGRNRTFDEHDAQEPL